MGWTKKREGKSNRAMRSGKGCEGIKNWALVIHVEPSLRNIECRGNRPRVETTVTKDWAHLSLISHLFRIVDSSTTFLGSVSLSDPHQIAPGCYVKDFASGVVICACSRRGERLESCISTTHSSFDYAQFGLTCCSTLGRRPACNSCRFSRIQWLMRPHSS